MRRYRNVYIGEGEVISIVDEFFVTKDIPTSPEAEVMFGVEMFGVEKCISGFQVVSMATADGTRTIVESGLSEQEAEAIATRLTKSGRKTTTTEEDDEECHSQFPAA